MRGGGGCCQGITGLGLREGKSRDRGEEGRAVHIERAFALHCPVKVKATEVTTEVKQRESTQTQETQVSGSYTALLHLLLTRQQSRCRSVGVCTLLFV